MYFVYIIRSVNHRNKVYVGRTINLKKRLSDHNSGHTMHTKRYKPWELVVQIGFKDEMKLLHLSNILSPVQEEHLGLKDFCDFAKSAHPAVSNDRMRAKLGVGCEWRAKLSMEVSLNRMSFMKKINKEELIDIVDKEGKISHSLKRSEVFEQGELNFRLVMVCIKNEHELFFIPRRAEHKKIYPGALSLVAGCVKSGETYQQALEREVKEEVGIDMRQVSCRLLGQITPHEHNAMGHAMVYEIICNDELSYTQKDFSEHFWLSMQELKERIQAGDKTTKNLPILLKRFYDIDV